MGVRANVVLSPILGGPGSATRRARRRAAAMKAAIVHPVRRPSGKRRVYLHVGTPKTGTTCLQDQLWRRNRVLREQGVLYPGLSSDAQFRAVLELRGEMFNYHHDPAVPGSWRRILDQARAWPGTVVLSHELLGDLDEHAIDRVIDDLSWAEVHLICTVRDLARQIPAAWQEDIKNRHVLTFDEFTHALRQPPGTAHHLTTRFWRLQDVAGTAEMWARRLPPAHIHLITVPAAGAPPGQLWARFSQVVGIEGVHLDPATSMNHSMGALETDLVRRVNLVLDERLGWPDYEVWVKHELATRILGTPEPSAVLTLPVPDREWVDRRSRLMVERLRESGYDVVGDLDDLIPTPAPDRPARDGRAGDGELLDLAVHAIAGLIALAAREGTPSPSWRRLVVRLIGRHAAPRRLHRMYLSGKARFVCPSL